MERVGNVAAAVPLYEGGLAALLAAVKVEQDDGNKKALRAKAAQCLTRAESLKGRQQPAVAASTGGLSLPPKRAPSAPTPLPPKPRPNN